jgi:hypothetical protein
MRFQKTCLALTSLLLSTLGMAAEVPLDENLVALFADTHVTADPYNPHQQAGLAQSVRDVLALNPRPAHVLFYGDLAFNRGETNDYRLLKALVKPLEEAGIRWSGAMGNHDRRAAFLSVFPGRQGGPPLVPGRLVSVVKTPHADFILLDSCLEGPVNGGIDDAQRTWLQETLARAAKPIFVGAHHPLAETGLGGLLAASTFGAGYIYGHNHLWRPQTQGGVETLCLPSTGHWGDIGYVLVKLDKGGAVFTLCQRDYYIPRPAAKPEDIKPEWKQRVQKNDGSQWRVVFKRQ